MELDQKYVDVIVQHWQTLRGNQARLGGDGRTLEEIAAAGREEPKSIRCRREIAAIEAEIRAGNPDLQGLCLGLSDWS